MGLEFPWAQSEGMTVVEPPQSPVGFEGFEKRLEVEFVSEFPSDFDGLGLRALERQDLDRLLKAAECTIVSQLTNKQFDSYVLSESSLFVYPLKIVIKTCGTTKLLSCIPILLAMASSLSLSVKCCKYRRGTFLFPEAQPFPHRNFDDEVEFLDAHFGALCGTGRQYILGSPSAGHQWHVYVASNGAECKKSRVSEAGILTLEMCMTGLDRKAANTFFKSNYETAEDMTNVSGIRKLLPRAQICDFAFEPCGYSMNSIEGGAYSTIHVTPEEACSYASFETMGYGPDNVGLEDLMHRVVTCFKPGLFSVSVYASQVADSEQADSWGQSPACPSGYVCIGSSRQELAGGDLVVYHTFKKGKSVHRSVKPAPLFFADKC